MARRDDGDRFAVVTTVQLMFSVALGIVTLLVTLFALYVVSTTVWGNRWFRR